MELQRDQDDRCVEPEPFNEGIENPFDVDESCVLLPPSGTLHPAKDADKLRDEGQRIRNSLNELRGLVNLQKTKLIQDKEERLMSQYGQQAIDQQRKVYEELEKLEIIDDKLIIILPKVRDQIDHALQKLREREKMINGKEEVSTRRKQDCIQREQDCIQREKDLIQREEELFRFEKDFIQREKDFIQRDKDFIQRKFIRSKGLKFQSI